MGSSPITRFMVHRQMARHWLLMPAFKGSSPFVPEIHEGSLGEKGKHDGFKIRSLLKVTGSSPVASKFCISKIRINNQKNLCVLLSVLLYQL